MISLFLLPSFNSVMAFLALTKALKQLCEISKQKLLATGSVIPSQLNPLQPGVQSHWYVPRASVHVPPF